MSLGEIFRTFAQICQLLNFCHSRKFFTTIYFLLFSVFWSFPAVCDCSAKTEKSRWSPYRVWNGTEVDCGTTSVGISKRNRRQRGWKQEKKTPSESSWEKRSWRNVEEKKEVGEHVKLRDSTAQHFEMQKLREVYSFCTLLVSEFSKWKKKWSGSGFTFVWTLTVLCDSARPPHDRSRATCVYSIFFSPSSCHDINFISIHKHYVDSHSHFTHNTGRGSSADAAGCGPILLLTIISSIAFLRPLTSLAYIYIYIRYISRSIGL